MTGPGAPTFDYRPHLDGLRAVAVYLVIGFHASLDRLEGGFIGVDVFFVLSGYLVTQVLLRDLRSDGRVSFGRFYARRARRLLPAAAVNLVATAVVFTVVAAPAELDAARRGITASALYVANWFFVRESADYFAEDVALSPVAHYWSLSVEEQFYLLWPLLLGGLVALAARAGARRDLVVRAVVVLGGLASLGAALAIATTDVDRAYYGTDTRAYQLLAGAALALSPALLDRVRGGRAGRMLPAAAVVLLGGLVILATSALDLGPITRGAVCAVLVVLLLVALEGSDRGVVRWVLSSPPLVYLGRISYGTYLWHWLVVVVVVRSRDLGDPAVAAVTAVVATGVAALSFEILEQPVRLARSLDRRRGAVIGVGLAMSLVVGLVVTPVLVDRGRSSASVAAEVPEGTPADVDWGAAFTDLYEYTDCPPGEGDACRVVAGDGARVLLVGESHAGMLTPMMEELASERDLDLWVGFLSFCPWPHGLRYVEAGATCLEEQDALYGETIPRVDPDVVVLAHRAVDDPADPLPVADSSGPLPAGDGPGSARAVLAERVTATVEGLRADGRRVVLVEPMPVQPADANPLTCLSQARFLEECRFVASPGPRPEEEVFRELAAADPEGVWSLDLDPLVCPYLPICDPVVDGLIVRRDGNHLTTTFATERLREPVAAFLADNGVIA